MPDEQKWYAIIKPDGGDWLWAVNDYPPSEMDVRYPVSYALDHNWGNRPTKRWAERAAKRRMRRLKKHGKGAALSPFVIALDDDDLQREFDRLQKELKRRGLHG
jgi:hypothetical protein